MWYVWQKNKTWHKWPRALYAAMWGDKEVAAAESGWEALLAARKRPAATTTAADTFWGEEAQEAEAKRPRTSRKALVFRMGLDACGMDQQDLEVRNVLTTCLPALLSESGDIDLRGLGVSRNALLVAMEFAAAGPGANERREDFWTPKHLRPISKASSPSEVVEKALHALEIFRVALHLGLPRLQAEAQRRLLGDGVGEPLLCAASAVPLLASSFRREKVISQRCMQLLLKAGPEFLHGRERQLGVIYATQPLVGCVLSGIFKAVSKSPSPTRASLDPVLEDLLLGPKGANLTESFDLDFEGQRSEKSQQKCWAVSIWVHRHSCGQPQGHFSLSWRTRGTVSSEVLQCGKASKTVAQGDEVMG